MCLESPQYGGVLILSCPTPVHSPGLDQEPEVLHLPHLHGSARSEIESLDTMAELPAQTNIRAGHSSSSTVLLTSM